MPEQDDAQRATPSPAEGDAAPKDEERDPDSEESDVPAGDETDGDDPVALKQKLADFVEKSKSEKGGYEQKIHALEKRLAEIDREGSGTDPDPLTARKHRAQVVLARKIQRLQQRVFEGDEEAEEELAGLELSAIQQHETFQEAQLAQIPEDDRDVVKQLARQHGSMAVAREIYRRDQRLRSLEAENAELKKGSKRERTSEDLDRAPDTNVRGVGAKEARSRSMALDKYNATLADPTIPMEKKIKLRQDAAAGRVVVT